MHDITEGGVLGGPVGSWPGLHRLAWRFGQRRFPSLRKPGSSLNFWALILCGLIASGSLIIVGDPKLELEKKLTEKGFKWPKSALSKREARV